MKPVSIFKQHVHLHFIVILLGFTAILGNLISINAIHLVWIRTFIAFIGLFIYLYFRKISFRISFKEQMLLYGIGVVVALHWVTFFHAVKVSNVSVTLGVFASTTLFTSFLEPLFQKRRVFWLEVLIGLIIIGGIYLIFQYEFDKYEGIIFSLISAFLNGLFIVFNRNISNRFHPGVISFYEMIGGFVAITIFFIVAGQMSVGLLDISWLDFLYLLVLGFVCTSYAFSALVEIMKYLSAYTVVLAVNMEPIYGIVLAFFIFGETEKMSGGFYLGALVIMSSVIIYPILKKSIGRRV
ncbi:MAG: DMT family transporter [Bacteroidetes bacterium]|nr:DMT family transporter [Bacteroidota bacterium]